MRCLSSYLPESFKSSDDCTPFIRKALADGTGILYIEPGVYRFNDVTIPDNMILAGAGPDTIISSAGGETIFHQHAKSNWTIRDLTIEGDGDTKNSSNDLGFKAISIDNCWGYEISSVSICKCNGIGIDIRQTPLGKNHAAFCHGGSLSKISFHDNFVGIRFDHRAEYISAVQLNAYNNVTGCIIHSGNVKIVASNFCGNIDGILIEDKENGSHGSISNCLVNHNERYAIEARGVHEGMAINGCCFYLGKIKLTDCEGISISNGQISCDVQINGAGVNHLVNNFVIPDSWKFIFSCSTLLSGNFSKNGPWEPAITRNGK
jgi:hypothetical protein